MRRDAEVPGRSVAAAACVVLAASLLAIAAAAESPVPDTSNPAVYRIAKDETHEGSLRIFRQVAEIAGLQQGTVLFFGQNLSIPGRVVGSVRAAGASLRIEGTVEGSVSAFCGKVELAPASHVTGDVRAFGGEIRAEGTIDGELRATGGKVFLGGTVRKDAHVESDLLEFGPLAKIEGKTYRNTRESVNVPEGAPAEAGSDVEPEIPVVIHVDPYARPAHHSVGSWFGLMLSAMLFGMLALAIFRRPAEAVARALPADPLRNLGVGFLAFIVVPFALLVSCILIVTIPFAVLALVAFAILVYLTQVPIALWVGSKILGWLRRPAAPLLGRFAAGIAALYLLYAIPFVRWLVVVMTVFLGLGAMIFGFREYRQERRGKRSVPDVPPPAPPEPVVAGPAA